MRLRHVTLTLLTVAALGAAPLALADPLDPDPSFGGDGIVKVDGFDRYSWLAEQQFATHGRRTYLAGRAEGGGSGESSLHIQVRGRKGHLIRSNGGYLEDVGAYPQLADVTIGHRVYAVGWQAGGYNEDKDREVPAYGFVAAFRRSLRGHLHWGTDRFASYLTPPGLEKLREVPFGSVTGGAIDSQGRVLVTGRVDGQTAVLRLTRDGHIDSSYGTSGLARVTIGTSSSPRDIAVHGTTAVVVGNATVNGHQQGFATEVTGFGYRDRSFSGDGIRFIGKPGTHVTAVDTADAGRWLVASQRRHRAGVTKLGSTGDLVTTFGRRGRATVRCTRPDDRNVIDALSTDRKDGDLATLALALSCRRDGDLRRLAAIWRPGGQPITSLKPDGVARLPWRAPTIDLTYGWRGRIVGLIPNRIVRLR